MLRDTPIQSVPGDLPRKWMIDGDFELIVWYERGEDPAGFEIIYENEGQPWALRWLRGELQQFQVDSGEAASMGHATPILRPQSNGSPSKVLTLFRERSLELDPLLRQFVLEKIKLSPTC